MESGKELARWIIPRGFSCDAVGSSIYFSGKAMNHQISSRIADFPEYV